MPDDSLVKASDSLKSSLTNTKLIGLAVSFTNWIYFYLSRLFHYNIPLSNREAV